MSPSPRSAGAAAVWAALALGGCVSSGHISRRTVDYNEAVEAARGQVLLLNVLRARDRRPMVFTGLTRITGSVRAESRLGVAGTVGEGAPKTANLSPSVSVVDSPSFDIAVLDSQEFTRGIMTPVSFELIEYFWDQGFVPEILLYLGVERIDVACPTDEAPRGLQNDPRAPSFATFRALVESLADTGRWETARHLSEEIGPPLDAVEVLRLPNLVQVAGGRLRLLPRPDGKWQLVRPSERLRLVAEAADPCTLSGAARTRLVLYDTKAALDTAPAEGPGTRRARLVARSPQSVLFYLGEMARPGREVTIRAREGRQPEGERRLFVVRDARVCPQAVVSAGYGGTRWVIPDGTGDCHPGRSMQVLSLAAQLLSLQQSARDLPAGGSLRIIGQ
jgi:hypothetical protein